MAKIYNYTEDDYYVASFERCIHKDTDVCDCPLVHDEIIKEYEEMIRKVQSLGHVIKMSLREQWREMVMQND